ncbi:hypothetical protein [Azospirillum argentinense]
MSQSASGHPFHRQQPVLATCTMGLQVAGSVARRGTRKRHTER